MSEFLLTAGAGPKDITAAPDGSVWFTQARAGNVAQLTANDVITEQAEAVKDDPKDGLDSAFGITMGPDGQSVWYTKPAHNIIACLTPT